MGLDNRIDALRDKHQDLDTAIALASTNIPPDELEINTLKKQKLRIKDELNSLAPN